MTVYLNRWKFNYLFVLCLLPILSVGYDINTECEPNNCSQRPRAEGDSDFICFLGRQTECDLKKEFNVTRNGHLSEAPRLIGVDIYMRYQEKSKSSFPTLNVSWVLPSRDAIYAVQAVQVDFSSSSNVSVQDYFYYKHTRCRLFDFRQTHFSLYDEIHPREQFFDCLLGLDSHDGIVYYVKLTSLPYGNSTLYMITKFDQSTVERWKSTVAVGFLRPRRTVHVVFELAPAEFGVSRYTLLLLKDREVAKAKFLRNPSNSVEFENVTEGNYTVKLQLVVGLHHTIPNIRSIEATTYNFEVTYPSIPDPRKSHVMPASGSSTIQILCALLGVLAGIVLICLSVYIYVAYRKRTQQPRARSETEPLHPTADDVDSLPSEPDLETSVFILNPIPGQEVTMEKFGTFMRKIFHCRIDPSYQSDVITNVNKLRKWMDNGLRNGGYVLVICTNVMRQGEIFQYGLDIISKYIKDHKLEARQIKRFLLAIRLNETLSEIPVELSGATQFLIPRDLDELQQHIHKGKIVTAREKYDPEWSEFAQHLADMTKRKQFCLSLHNDDTGSFFLPQNVSCNGDSYSQQLANIQSK